MTYLGLSSDCSCVVATLRKGRMNQSLGSEHVSCSSVLSLSADSSPWIMWTSGGLCTLDLCGKDSAAAGAAVATDGAAASSTSGASADTVGSEAPIVDNSALHGAGRHENIGAIVRLAFTSRKPSFAPKYVPDRMRCGLFLV